MAVWRPRSRRADVIKRHLLGEAGGKGDEANGGALTLTQRFGSADDLHGDLHCLVRDGINRYGPTVA